MARELSASGPDNIRIVNPTGVTLASADWTAIFKLQLNVTPSFRNGILKLGENNDTDLTRGFLFGADSDRKLAVFEGFSTSPTGSALTLDTWYNIGITRASGGTFKCHIDGTEEISQSTDTPGNLESGDVWSHGRIRSVYEAPDIIVAMSAWLQGVILSNAACDSYADDPCALITDYGPGGGVVADALKILTLGDQSVDLAQSLTVALTGGSQVAGPTDYPTSCAAGPTLDQFGYRFYADDDVEGENTPLEAENTPATLERGVPFRLRIGVDATGDPDAKSMQLEYRRVGDTTWRKVE